MQWILYPLSSALQRCVCVCAILVGHGFYLYIWGFPYMVEPQNWMIWGYPDSRTPPGTLGQCLDENCRSDSFFFPCHFPCHTLSISLRRPPSIGYSRHEWRCVRTTPTSWPTPWSTRAALFRRLIRTPTSPRKLLGPVRHVAPGISRGWKFGGHRGHRPATGAFG